MAVALLVKRPAPAALDVFMASLSKSSKHQEIGTRTSHCKDERYLLESFVAYDVIAETDCDMVRVAQPCNKSPTEYIETLWNKGLFGKVCDEYVLKGIFIEGFPDSIRFSMSSYLGWNNSALVQDLERHVTSLTKLQTDRVEQTIQESPKRRKTDKRTGGQRLQRKLCWGKRAVVDGTLHADPLLNTTSSNGHTDMALAFSAYSEILLTTIFYAYSRWCTFLLAVPGETTTDMCKVVQLTRSGFNDTPEMPLMDHAEWIPRTLPAERRELDAEQATVVQYSQRPCQQAKTAGKPTQSLKR